MEAWRICSSPIWERGGARGDVTEASTTIHCRYTPRRGGQVGRAETIFGRRLMGLSYHAASSKGELTMTTPSTSGPETSCRPGGSTSWCPAISSRLWHVSGKLGLIFGRFADEHSVDGRGNLDGFKWVDLRTSSDGRIVPPSITNSLPEMAARSDARKRPGRRLLRASWVAPGMPQANPSGAHGPRVSVPALRQPFRAWPWFP